MNFKEMVANDNLTVFINPEEFGEPKNIDGETLMVVVDYDLINERPHLYAEGTYLSKVTFFVHEADLGYVPAEGQEMRFGDVGKRGYPYLVTNVASNMGILEITIEANET
ncbi:hypothetical protein ACM1RC_26140 [Paenibacillus azoreducens]|uniref:hypothetical protein n=1 Tax=Paenibacillus azoreducens TaxID=116718 RepID=UPI0039F5258B